MYTNVHVHVRVHVHEYTHTCGLGGCADQMFNHSKPHTHQTRPHQCQTKVYTSILYLSYFCMSEHKGFKRGLPTYGQLFKCDSLNLISLKLWDTLSRNCCLVGALLTLCATFLGVFLIKPWTLGWGGGEQTCTHILFLAFLQLTAHCTGNGLTGWWGS